MARMIMHQSVQDLDPTPEQHLDEDWQSLAAIDAGATDYLFRIWETSRPAVVVGRNTPLLENVRQDACDRDGIRVLRRCSGGGAVVLGPGCLNYAIAVSLVSHPELAEVAASFRAILGRIIETLGVPDLSIAGGSDLALNGCKVSGNAQRRGRRGLLHHGTLLYNFDASLAARYLKEPRRQPVYRAARRHVEFMGNLPLAREILRDRVNAGLRRPLTHMHNGAHVPTR